MTDWRSNVTNFGHLDWDEVDRMDEAEQDERWGLPSASAPKLIDQWKEVVDETLEKQARIRAGKETAGHPWGLPQLDSHVKLQPSKLYILGGVKKCAKTQFLLSTMIHNLTRTPPVHCALFSLEMTEHEIACKILSHVSKVDSRKILSRHLGEQESEAIKAHASTVRQYPLLVEDNSLSSCESIYSKAKRWKKECDIPDGEYIVAVDFLQLIPLDLQKGTNEASGIRQVAYDLAYIAKNLHCVVLAVAQLNNQAEGQRPHMRYLEGSGGIAQGAEAVLLLDLKQRRDERFLNEGVRKSLDVIVAAQRTGESGVVVKCKADLSTGRFVEVGTGDG